MVNRKWSQLFLEGKWLCLYGVKKTVVDNLKKYGSLCLMNIESGDDFVTNTVATIWKSIMYQKCMASDDQSVKCC